MQRRTTVTTLISVGVLVALAVSGCGAAPDSSPSTSPAASNFLPCAVSDLTGFKDKDFNELTYNGVKAAADKLGVKVATAESSAEDQYAGNISALVNEGCNLIVTVGFALASATRDSAKLNTDVDFALIDSALSNDDFSPLVLPNVKPVLFDTAQAAVLAGYLAAGATKTGVVGTFGGMPFPSVTVFMDGFADGIAHYNEVHGATVKLLGWDKAKQDGLFVGSFDDQNQAKTITENMLDQGADIVMPVAGTLFKASIQAMIDQKIDGAVIGVNSDVYISAPEFKSYYLTSVMKNLTTAAEEVTLAAADGKFDNTAYIGTLANNGVGIAPAHDWESKLDPALLAEVDKLKADIISGAFVVDSPSSPKG
ncbi:basic membrane protein A [Cryobacterium mesophilum]|uniref:BMP family ABC transporter substrate-binding protein n=1 Tax=Terrimesophilobacter mesophilus TaxID=433647 RepID=A0A4R8VD75_9MICO|nr:BMP family ABC transporter substrate-binding protein [Terrimesophilobacter mesophilus]MBB5633359.1 basic membrane protein A [Terrimesophilobacter mesophilus]TFB80090.1 BMP family ABC transporter substrate-binding protein [Terrimesophilobacter mesophilus]